MYPESEMIRPFVASCEESKPTSWVKSMLPLPLPLLPLLPLECRAAFAFSCDFGAACFARADTLRCDKRLMSRGIRWNYESPGNGEQVLYRSAPVIARVVYVTRPPVRETMTGIAHRMARSKRASIKNSKFF